MGLLATQLHWPVPLAMLGALVVALLIGLTNGIAVVKTGLPSFLVTLAMFFALQGLNVGITVLVNKPPETGGPVPATALVVAGIRGRPRLRPANASARFLRSHRRGRSFRSASSGGS